MSFKAPSSAEIVPGQLVHFTLTFDNGEVFECEGRILWMKSATERQGSMKQYGMRFLSLPGRLDAAIMKAINENKMSGGRLDVGSGKRSRQDREGSARKLSFRSALPSILGALLVVALTAAFLAAVWLHDQTHSENSIARKFNRGIDRKVSAVSDLPH